MKTSNIENSFIKIIEKYNLTNKKILLAISGGIDSMVLFNLLLKNNLEFSIAHVNYNLRIPECNIERKFLQKYSAKYKIKIFEKDIDNQIYQDSDKSIQMIARDIRYNWFNELYENEYKFDFLLTAHHLDDNIETFLLNIFKTSSIDSFVGIREYNNKLLRPLLKITKDEINQYAEFYNIDFMQDKSNFESKYKRNYIRNEIIPIINKKFPYFKKSIVKNIEILTEYELFIKQSIQSIANELIIKSKETDNNYELKINIEKLKHFNHKLLILFEILKKYKFKFSQIKKIIELLDQKDYSGKEISSKDFILIIERSYLILKNKVQEKMNLLIKDIKIINLHNEIDKDFNNPRFAYIDGHKIKGKLALRKWKSGDKFMPLGMKKYKKLSDFFIDNKIENEAKQNVFILIDTYQLSNDEKTEEIVWVEKLRLSEKYKITNKTIEILKIELI